MKEYYVLCYYHHQGMQSTMEHWGCMYCSYGVTTPPTAGTITKSIRMSKGWQTVALRVSMVLCISVNARARA